MNALIDPRTLSTEQHAALYDEARARAKQLRRDALRDFAAALRRRLHAALGHHAPARRRHRFT